MPDGNKTFTNEQLSLVYPSWVNYRSKGGDLDFDTWVSRGMPKPLPRIPPVGRPISPDELFNTQSWFQPQEPTNSARVTITPKDIELATLKPKDTKPTQPTEGDGDATAADDVMANLLVSMPVSWGTEVKNGYVWRIGYDKNGNIVEYEPVGAAKEGQKEYGAEPEEQYYTDDVGNLHRVSYRLTSQGWDKEDEVVQFAERVSKTEQAGIDISKERLTEERRQFDIEQELSKQRLAFDQQQQSELISWYREQQAAELEASRQTRLANLRANPASWLEYASLAGETPAVQPWMIPLSPQDYNLQAGQPLPGWTGEGSLSGLPQLLTPSTQYIARTTPSAREQYHGYEQARTGASPSDVEWRLWSQAPPGGGGGTNLNWIR